MARELWSLRWEAATDEEFAQNVATVLGPRCRALELSCDTVRATRVVVEADGVRVESVRARMPVESSTQRRPRAGWPDSDAVGHDVGATGRTTVMLRCRHARGYLVLWTAGTTISTALMELLAAGLGLIVDARVLVQRVAKLSRTAYSDNRRLRRHLQERTESVARSPAMRHCLGRAIAVAPFQTPVLVTGPSGAGKELVSREIHQRSPWASGPFVTLNCGAIPESLAESELFGHRKGAFTGATSDRKGVFERARGGTLLLDEVGELSPSTQVKLLRALQEGTFTPVGSEREQHSDARVIAATHRDLAARVRAGAFREDLFYRLAVFEVRVPALAERSEDIPQLVQQIVGRVSTRMGRSAPTVSRAVMRQLVNHDWPGNVRELENVLEGALVMNLGAKLEGPLQLGAGSGTLRVSAPVQPLATTIRHSIEAALSATHGKIYGDDGAARLLGLHPATLQSKMRKHGIERDAFVRPGR